MNATVSTPDRNPLTQLTYRVLIEKHEEDLYSARIWELPECRSSGSSKEEALKSLHRLLVEYLKKVEIVSLTTDIPKAENPLMKWAGAFKNDPYFDEMLEDIAELRRERDLEMVEYDDRLDRAEATNKNELEETVK
ncbi:MAG: type II toxin-antitoxin system HicB family antitoxin [Oscillatoriaceae cyanobacterium Prado104]|jgi:predicted RNase H-like HicB family nuclease|nr:type II toxin-antitoxin system HicB family antitoxin [Oscillatoriaceae cyanobacterium Prado104]